MDRRGWALWSRRELLGGLATVGAGGLLNLTPETASAEPPPETTTLRLIKITGTCTAPQYVADDLLKGEGFGRVEYVPSQAGIPTARTLASGQADISMNFVAPSIIRIDAGDPIVLLAGIHVGCFELFGTQRVRQITDLRGKTVAVQSLGSSQQIFLASMAAYVGLDPQRDIKWVARSSPEGVRLLADGKIDAYMAFAPEQQEIRAKKIGHVVVNSAADHPWSQYFCCAAVGNRNFVQRNPVATKRAVRAILKAADICAVQPERAARAVVTKGFYRNYDYTLQTLRELSYRQWRTYDPEDAVRFWALRLREARVVKGTPQKIIAEGTDWRFFNELKKELKA